jgi:solute carrier family 13 (sodium-dependent dicarboxylate transporter), member 2/3/5
VRPKENRVTQVRAELSNEVSSESSRLLLRILSGPIAFVVVWLIPLAGLNPNAHFGLSAFAWTLAWWVTTPVPWSVTGFLPLVLFPLGGVMSFNATAALYGQRVLPFVLGVMLFGHAFQKHGLARRMAVNILSIAGVATSGNRLILMILISTAAVGTLIDSAGTVAIMLPIAMSVARFAAEAETRKLTATGGQAPRLMEAAALAVLFGAAAGGMATPAGVVFNPLAISLLEQLTGYRVSFAQWTMTGVFLTAAAIPVYFLTLRVMSPTEIKEIADGAAHFRRERTTLGPMNRGEKNVLAILIVMVALWFSPAVVAIRGIDIWIVPAIAIMLLFLVPIDLRRGEMTLTTKDFQVGVLWNVLFMIVSSAAAADALEPLGITEWFGVIVKSGVSVAALPWFTAFITPIVAHLTSGTAATTMLSTILFPLSVDLGFNPAILARIITGTALGICFPFAGAAAGTAFASGAISFSGMAKAGIVATIMMAVVVTALAMVLVPAFGAFTPP